jgi:hypothetical protein
MHMMMDNFTVEQLLIMSLNTFQILKDSGKWNYLSPGKEQVVALTSEVTRLKDHNLKLENNAKPTKNKNSGDKPKQSGKGKTPGKKAADEEKWAWKKVPPKEVDPQSKQVPDFDEIHHWCEDHHAWVVHTPESCTVLIAREEAETAQALATVLEGFESDERYLESLFSFVAAWYLGVLWLKLMFISTYLSSLECALSYMIVPDIYDIYL